MIGQRAANLRPAPIKTALSWIAALLLAAVAFAAAIGEVLTEANSPVVSKIGIGNRARADLNLMLVQVGSGKVKLTDPQVEEAALNSLAAWPLNARALVVLATRSIQVGDKPAALRYARLGNRMSRRELGAQVVLLGDALDRGDLPAAVRLLDISMRSAGERQRAVMYPVLAQGLKEPGFRRAVAPVVDQQRDWASPFFTFAVEEGNAVDEVASLYLTLEPATRRFLAPTLLSRLVTKLTDAGRVDEARRIVLSTPGKRAADLSDLGMTAATFDPEIGSLGWKLEDSPTVSARQVLGENKGEFAILVEVGPGDASLALNRILFLKPGAYTFTARERVEGGEGKVAWQWIMRCNGKADGAEIWRSTEGTRVAIPRQCQSQLMQLLVNQTDSANYGQLIVDNVNLGRGAISAAPAPRTDRGVTGN